MLQSLLLMSSKDGVTLPTRNPQRYQASQSTLSINTVTDTMEHTNEALWSDICLKFRKAFIEKLQSLPVSTTTPQIKLENSKRLHYLQSLCTLFPDSEVWNRYKSLRSQQVQSVLNLHSDTGDDISFLRMCNSFCDNVPNIISMINDDLETFNSGVLSSQISVFAALHDIYLEKLMDEVSFLLKYLHSDLLASGHKPEGIPKSTSEMVKVSKGKFSLRRGISRSLDTLMPKENKSVKDESDTFTDLEAFPWICLKAMIRLVTSLLCIETHIETLYNSTVWEIMGTIRKKSHSKTRLRSKYYMFISS